jgi:hypothetical protein
LISNLILIMNLTFVLVFFLIIFINDFLILWLYLIPIWSLWNIVNHISAKYKLVWCCLQYCVIGAHNSLVTIKLIEGSNQMDYLPVILDFHDCFPSQMIWAYCCPLTTLCTFSMIVSACVMLVVICSWFGFNTIIVLKNTFVWTHVWCCPYFYCQK